MHLTLKHAGKQELSAEFGAAFLANKVYMGRWGFKFHIHLLGFFFTFSLGGKMVKDVYNFHCMYRKGMGVFCGFCSANRSQN